MKSLLATVVLVLLCSALYGQRTIKLHNLWAKPQVHVLFEGYTVSFKIKDINRALVLLNEAGDYSWGSTSGLDTARTYHLELYRRHMEYHNRIEPLMQHVVGPFLLTAGQAEVRKGRKKLREIIVDITPVNRDDSIAHINFYDPRNKRMFFTGSMAVEMYNRDIGID